METNATNLENCDKIYQSIERNAALNTPLQKAQAMQQQGKECIATGMYDVWLASYYQDGGDYPTSVKIVQSALDKVKTDEARPNLLQLLAEAENQIGDETKAIKLAEGISHDYPEYTPILGFLAEEAFKKEDWKLALDYSQKIHNIDNKNVSSLMAQAAALHQLGRHEEAVNAVNKALDLEPERIGKTTGVLEAIFSLAILNRRPEAAELAKRHIAANPNWRDNRTFAQAVKELGE